MKTKIILTAIAITTFFFAHTFSYSQGCGGMSKSSSGKNMNEATAQPKSSGKENPTASNYTCPMHPEVVNANPGKCQKCGMDLVQKASENEKAQQQKDTVGYTCPMHPEVRSDKPGNCPKCGMALVKKSDASGMKMMCPMMGGMKDMNKAETKDKNKSSSDSKKDQTTIYTCPMHPDVKLDKPGKCPQCGMNLIEKKS